MREFKTQEDLDAIIEIGDVVITELGERLKCMGKDDDGHPLFEMF